jgi:hypothetical protein
MLALGGSSFARGSLRQEGRDPHQVVGEHRSSYQQLEALAALGETALKAFCGTSPKSRKRKPKAGRSSAQKKWVSVGSRPL